MNTQFALNVSNPIKESNKNVEMTLDISIVIPSYNRSQVVKENVEKCMKLLPPAKEIILVDDYSDRESETVLQQLAASHSSIKYFRLIKNCGQATARSVGFSKATGKYIVSLDDDSWFIDNDGLQRVWERMESLPGCGILAFETYGPTRATKPEEDRLLLVADHITCGAAYRTSVLNKTGYHLGFLRFMGEESELSIKVMDAGFDIILDGSIRVYHDYDPEKRSRDSLAIVRYHGVRNDLVRAVIYFPFPLYIQLVLWRIYSHLKFALQHGFLLATIHGYLGFLMYLPAAFRSRKPVGLKVAKRYLELRRFPEPVNA